VTTPSRFDPRAAWEALTPGQQATVGTAALLLIVASDANCDDAATTRWQHAESEAWRILAEDAPDFGDCPEGPDLGAIGIRACRECGCTTEYGCPGNCLVDVPS
jgi:hypothetical protein